MPALALLPWLAVRLDDPFLVRLFTRIVIFAIAAVALNFVLGFGGLASLFHASFMGIGGYVVGVFARHDSNETPLMLGPLAISGTSDLLITIPLAMIYRYSSHWNQFISECRTPDFLDTITVIYRYLFWHGSEEIALWWRDTVRQIFAEENLAYVLDDVGGVHPAIDQEFQRNLVSTIAALQSERYQNIRQLAENASYHLRSEPPNYKQAWRATLSAVEGLFGLMFPYVRLTVDETSVVYCPRCRARTKETRRRREPHE